MSKKHRSKKIAPGAFAAVMATAAAAAPETFSAVTKADEELANAIKVFFPDADLPFVKKEE